MTIVGAKGLRKADIRSSDPYCVCEVPGKKGFKFQTAVVKRSLNPNWSCEHEFAEIARGALGVVSRRAARQAPDLWARGVLASDLFPLA